jgi:hypothetical protein
LRGNGKGTLEIFKLTKGRGLKLPLIPLYEGFKVTIWRPSANTIHETEHDTIHETEHDVSIEFSEVAELTHRLVLVLNGEMSRPQLIVILELKNRPHFATNYLDPAIKDGLIEMTIPEKSKSKNQRYRLTQKGLALKDNLKISKSNRR